MKAEGPYQKAGRFAIAPLAPLKAAKGLTGKVRKGS